MQIFVFYQSVIRLSIVHVCDSLRSDRAKGSLRKFYFLEEKTACFIGRNKPKVMLP